MGIENLREGIADDKNAHVLVTILTDGMENVSRRYNRSYIKEIVTDLESKNWLFTYIGTDHDVHSMADSIGIKNHLSWSKSGDGVKNMVMFEASTREEFYSAVMEDDAGEALKKKKKGFFSRLKV